MMLLDPDDPNELSEHEWSDLPCRQHCKRPSDTCSTLYGTGRSDPKPLLSRFTQSQTPFEIVFPDGRRRSFGDGPPSFTLTLRNRQALRAFASMDEGRVGDAYVAGHVDIEGDMLRLSLPKTLSTR